MLRHLVYLPLRHPRASVGVAVGIAVLSGIVGTPVSGLLQQGGFDDPGSQSAQARQRAAAVTGIDPVSTVIALVDSGHPASDPAARAKVAGVASTLAAEAGVVRVLSPYGSSGSITGPSLISRDGRTAEVVAQLRPLDQTELIRVGEHAESALGHDPQVQLGGYAVTVSQFRSQVSSDLARAELLAFPVLLILLLLVFRGAIAALVPLGVGVIAIVVTEALIRGVNEVYSLSIFAINLTTGLGLGLAIDYSLLLVSRFREEGGAVRDMPTRLRALRRTLTTAGRTVLFSAMTVTAALASLLVFPLRYLQSMGVAGILTTLTAMATALLVLPAVLLLLGHRIDALAPRGLRYDPVGDRRRGAWYRLAHGVMRRPVIVAAATGAVLVLAGLPTLRMELTSVDARSLPAGHSASAVAERLRSDFAVDTTNPIGIVVDAPTDAAAHARVTRLADAVSGVAGIGGVAPPQPAGSHTWLLTAAPQGDALSSQSRGAVEAIRSLPSSDRVLVAGQTADFVDQLAALRARLPLAIGIVAGCTLLILLALTGSVVLPLKALLMNLLTLSTAIGALVLIFQDGHLGGVLRFATPGGLESTNLVILFALVFGLSTDYGVFLLSRIREAVDEGHPNQEAVARGLERTGRIVTAAALCFCVAIGAFATSAVVVDKEIGVGTAVAVLVDASLVRALLVPALMRLLGAWNWWAPGPLRRLLARLGLEGLDGSAVSPSQWQRTPSVDMAGRPVGRGLRLGSEEPPIRR